MYIDTASKYICGYEDLRFAVSKLVNDLVAIGAFKRPMESGNFMPLCFHTLFYFIGGSTFLQREIVRNQPQLRRGQLIAKYHIKREKWTYFDKDNRRSYSHEPVEFHKHLVLVILGVAVHVELLDSLNRKFLVFKSN
jgi:hypothetical protein